MSSDHAPFFIVGSPRSGTSLLSRMINMHSRLTVPYESHLYNTFLPWKSFYGDLSDSRNQLRLVQDILRTDVMQDWNPRLSTEQVMAEVKDGSFSGIFDAVLSAWMRLTEKERWGEKTPQHLFYAEEILKTFPDAKFIHIVRDGRDVALSLLKARFGPKTLYGAAGVWKRYVQEVEKLRAVLPDGQFHELSYESLLSNPETTLRSVCSFLGETFEPATLEYYSSDAQYKTDRQNQKNLQKPLISSNQQKWKEELSSKEVRIVESVCGETLLQKGYGCVDENAVMSSFERIWYARVVGPPRKLCAMMRNFKGIRDGLIRLSIRLKLRFSSAVRR